MCRVSPFWSDHRLIHELNQIIISDDSRILICTKTASLNLSYTLGTGNPNTTVCRSLKLILGQITSSPPKKKEKISGLKRQSLVI